MASIRSWLQNTIPQRVESILEEVVRTQRSLRNLIEPRYQHDERFMDLKLCLKLDGYIVERETLSRTEPDLDGYVAVEDDLTQALNSSGLSKADEIKYLLDKSAEDFRKSPSDLNGALTNARVALQTLATEISAQHAASRPGGFDETKWGSIIFHLRASGVISLKEEEGLTGVFSFISPGAHQYIGLSEEEMVRLGRSLAVSMIYFLVKRWNG
jgi:hypothetical protein